MHGIVYDTLDFVQGILDVEMNAATDNPMVFATNEDRPIISGGNFHGEYPGTRIMLLSPLFSSSLYSQRKLWTMQPLRCMSSGTLVSVE